MSSYPPKLLRNWSIHLLLVYFSFNAANPSLVSRCCFLIFSNSSALSNTRAPACWDSANSSSSEESSAGDGSDAGSDSEPDPSPSRFDLVLLRLLDERLDDI